MRIWNLWIFILWIFAMNPNITLGFLDNVGTLDMYKKIDKWTYELELNFIERELRWWDINASIVENLQNLDNFYNVRSCFDTEFTSQEIADIANDTGWEKLFEKLQNCVSDDSISITNFAEYQAFIKNYYNQSVEKAQTKSANIQKIANIWLYSDGIEENSPFDLLIDLENINRIIFEEELEYQWFNNFDIWKYVWDTFAGREFQTAPNYWFPSQWNTNNSQNGTTQWAVFPLPQSGSWHEFACNINDSWFSQETYNSLTQTQGNSNSWSNTPPNEVNQGWNNSNNSQENDDFFKNYSWNYTKVNDNAFWPCNTFFCIKVDMITYRQNLLKGRNTIAIETLINRSNEHISKFAYTSLVPSTMTTNNFELGFQWLNLADIFHVWVQVTTKPVPFLNLDKNNTREWRDETEYASKNLLTRYYTNLGLNYERANDLSQFTQEESTLKSILDNTELQITNTTQAQQELNNYRANMARQNEFVSHSIDKKIMNDEMSEFQSKFTELQKFSQSLLEYSKNLQALAKKLDEKSKQ